ncbi:MAG: DNA endonuclease SmrA [Gammaproteobacteria bacterium]|nr:DNA endonuclease SmrA [Gammaproteobacteria bacterium]MYF37692.1 DNA endonuclease SmrA [Gammaproteobacteria bacterium]
MSNDKQSLFEQELSDVQALESKPRADAHKQVKNLNPDRAQARTNATLEPTTPCSQEPQPDDLPFVEPDDHLEWKSAGVQPETMNKLRSGRYPIQDKLDLHNLRVTEAFRCVQQFFAKSIEKHLRTVLVVHGTGLRSKPPAQLKSHVAHWLKNHPQVNAFVTAPRHQGGSGATLVHLKKSKSAKLETKERIARRLG